MALKLTPHQKVHRIVKTLVMQTLADESRHGNFIVDALRGYAVWRPPENIHQNQGIVFHYVLTSSNDIEIMDAQWETPPLNSEMAWRIALTQLQYLRTKSFSMDDITLGRHEWTDDPQSRLFMRAWVKKLRLEGWGEQLDALHRTLSPDMQDIEKEGFLEWMNRLVSWCDVRGKARNDMTDFCGWIAIVAWKYKHDEYVLFPGLTLNKPKMEGIDRGMRTFVFEPGRQYTKEAIPIPIRVRDANDTNPFKDFTYRWSGLDIASNIDCARNIALGMLPPVPSKDYISFRCTQMLNLADTIRPLWSLEAASIGIRKMQQWFEPTSPMYSWFSERESQMDALGISPSFSMRWPIWVEYARRQLEDKAFTEYPLPTLNI